MRGQHFPELSGKLSGSWNQHQVGWWPCEWPLQLELVRFCAQLAALVTAVLSHLAPAQSNHLGSVLCGWQGFWSDFPSVLQSILCLTAQKYFCVCVFRNGCIEKFYSYLKTSKRQDLPSDLSHFATWIKYIHLKSGIILMLPTAVSWCGASGKKAVCCMGYTAA